MYTLYERITVINDTFVVWSTVVVVYCTYILCDSMNRFNKKTKKKKKKKKTQKNNTSRNRMFWIFVRIASMRRFYQISKQYVLCGNTNNTRPFLHFTLLIKESVQRQIHFNGMFFGNKCCCCIEGSRYHLSLPFTHLSPASLKWDTGKECRPGSDAAERGVWSGSTLFA